MRPQEILGMIEEAAGTRMFEDRKAKAYKEISKKEKRVQELEVLIEEEAAPKISKLREEKRQYVQWQKSCTELERIGRTLRAWEWDDARKRAAAKKTDIVAAEKEMEGLLESKVRFEKEIKAAEKDMAAVNAQRDKELKKGGKFKQLEEQVSELGKAVTKVRTQVEIKTGGIKEEETKMGSLESHLETVSNSLP